MGIIYYLNVPVLNGSVAKNYDKFSYASGDKLRIMFLEIFRFELTIFRLEVAAKSSKDLIVSVIKGAGLGPCHTGILDSNLFCAHFPDTECKIPPPRNLRVPPEFSATTPKARSRSTFFRNHYLQFTQFNSIYYKK